MASTVTYQGDARRSEPSGNGLFAGQKLWFSRGIPSRQYLVDQAINNGAQVVQLDKQADIKLVDHLKKNHAPDTYSYQYVEQSIRNARLEDLESHRIGSVARVNRPVGSVTTAPKGSRNRFTEEDDQLLWNWLRPYVDNAGMWKGNEIYKQLEQVNPNHTYQSWRDRWLKYTQFQERKVTAHVDPFDRANDETEVNPRSPKRQRVGNRAKPQQANISVPQSRQGLVQDQRLIVQVMGNTPSMLDSSETRMDGVQPQIARKIPSRIEPNLEQESGPEANTASQVVENEVEIVSLGDHSSDASDEASSISRQDELNDGKQGVLDNGRGGVSADGSRLPLLFNFTQNDARRLYSATCHILDSRPDTLEGSWTDVAKENGHTKDAWKKFFYEAIVPEYMRRNGLENEAQLEIHYKAVNKAKREREAAEKREEEAANAHAASSRSDRGIQQPTTEAPANTQNHVYGGHETSKDDGNPILDGTPIDMRLSEDHSFRGTAEQTEFARRSATPPSNTQYRLPKPNESRKLSQPRGSQSTSSQSKSMSTSQPTPVSQSLLNEVAETAVVVTDTVHMQTDTRTLNNDNNVSTQTQSAAEELQPKRQREETQKIDTASDGFLRPPQPSQPAQSVQLSQERIGDESRFVTQWSTREDSISTDATGLGDIPFRDPSLPVTRSRSESPLFVPEEPERLTSESASEPEQISDAEDEDEERGNPASVQLFEDADAVSDGIHTSEYAPSDVPSEGIQFESQVRLSQAWETAPEGEYVEETPQVPEPQAIPELDQDPPLAANIAFQRDTQTTVNPEETNTEGDFETAPSGLQIERLSQSKEDDVTETGPSSDPTTRNTLDTQALFHQPTQVPFTEIAAIPEPPGGWDDEEIPLPTRKEVIDTNTNTHAVAEDADWTLLPLPEPNFDQHDTAVPPAKDSEDIDMDEWLEVQSKTHTSIPKMLLKPLSHQALELTSMNFDLARSVLTRMVQRFEKGKHPADRSLVAVRKLPKKERKAAISKIVDDLVPNDMRGCWTREDDEALLGVNGREVKRVEDKHGEEGVRSRFEFLEMWHAE